MTKYFTLLILGIFSFAKYGFTQETGDVVTKTADTLAKKIVSSQRKTVAVTDFINLDQSVTQLGNYLSSEISGELANYTDNQTKFRVLERSKLDQIFKEKQLIQSVDGSDMAKELGRLSVADVLIFGIITDIDYNKYEVRVRLLDTKTGDALSSYKAIFFKTPTLDGFNKTIIKRSPLVQNNYSPPAQEAAKPAVVIEQPKPVVKPDYGDYCFKNAQVGFSNLTLKIKIYKPDADEIEKVISVNTNETSCAYNLLAGVHKLELIFYDSWKKEVKRDNKEIRVTKGDSQTVEYSY